MNKIFGFIGIGNMGFSMLQGANKAFSKEQLIYTDISEKRVQWVEEQTGIKGTNSNLECIQDTKIIILAIKPQYYEEVLNGIKGHITKDQIVISIAPGININKVKKTLGNDIRVIRAMPNTPALIGEGMTAMAYSNDHYTEEEKELVNAFFTSFGECVALEEKLMDSVVPIIGSSPAYVFMFIEALADGAVKLGLSRDEAYKMASQTVFGSAKMVLETKEHPAVLKDQVCSPGGTTIEAVAALEKNGFRNAILEAVQKCYDKCERLGS
ncbi:pyrroline-5-carboxylate reductase [Natranaerovirga hydrolytica]|uniref:Pyrroline-5-carboxylate reductase n=1 Tax=Natranaerovirga hydrolytica TaxID=680378 RepID=A0A4R1MXW8_9FIRM|nr:pyrroline-5-carboxylate reductase [Natranaerovirga hydrolytica]TCK97965.1 pyrroline-5-carboxylate reductase [Natranaerovirga hydrolytica]